VQFAGEPVVADLLGEPDDLLELGEHVVEVVRTERPERGREDVRERRLVTDPAGHLDGAPCE
jgi:hypothetical protein